MSTTNPYFFSSTSPPGTRDAGTPDAAMDGTILALVATRPWVRVMGCFSTIGFLLFGFRCLFAAPTVFFRIADGKAQRFAFYEIVSGLIFFCSTMVFYFAAKYLLSYASRISRVEESRSMHDIAEALVLQQKTWKLVTVCTAVAIMFFVVVYASTTFIAGFNGLFNKQSLNDLSSHSPASHSAFRDLFFL